MDELEFVMHKSQKKSVGVEDIHKKINDIESHRALMEAKTFKEIGQIKVNLGTIKSTNKVIQEECMTFKQQNDNIREDVREFYDRLTHFKQEFNSELSRI
jgi:formiminotetrahydrofolate cyclodeaminase